MIPRIAQFDEYDTPEQKRCCYRCQYPDCIVPDNAVHHCTAYTADQMARFLITYNRKHAKTPCKGDKRPQRGRAPMTYNFQYVGQLMAAPGTITQKAIDIGVARATLTRWIRMYREELADAHHTTAAKSGEEDT